MRVPTKFSDWLLDKYLKWQIEDTKRKTLTEFASWLGVGLSALSQWMNGKQPPDRSSADKLALRLGLETYDILDMQRPDEHLYRIERSWHVLKDADREEFARLIEERAAQVQGDKSVSVVAKKKPLASRS